jgi:hypothetical protein
MAQILVPEKEASTNSQAPPFYQNAAVAAITDPR